MATHHFFSFRCGYVLRIRCVLYARGSALRVRGVNLLLVGTVRVDAVEGCGRKRRVVGGFGRGRREGKVRYDIIRKTCGRFEVKEFSGVHFRNFSEGVFSCSGKV